MDLRIPEAPPSAEERLAVDSVLGPPESGWSGGKRTPADGHVASGGLALARNRRHLLLPALHALQERVGWISLAGLGYLCTRLDVPPAEAYGVASAYALFAFEPGPPVVVHVCDDVACRAASGGDPTEGLARRHGPPGSGEGVTWRPSPCLGHCEHGSAALVQVAGERGGCATLAPFAHGDMDRLVALGTDLDLADLPAPLALVPQAGAEDTRLLRRVGRVDPASLDAYRAAGGYEALRRALELGPAGVIGELKEAKLLGRGGAAFPTGAKWEAVARNPLRPHYFVANADESEPGTFKDRVLLDHDPYALVEALTVAGVTTGAEKGFVYLRGEYPLAAARLEHAAAVARSRGLLGSDVMGSGIAFDFEVRRGAGAYVAGEETALFNSLEGRRPEPRNKPPYPVDRGLFDKPTGVNNVETLLSVLEVLRRGAAAYAELGTPGSTGTRLFCLSGRVAGRGVYEVPMGTTLGALLELAGGVVGGRPLQAVLLGGAAGSFVGPDELDLPLSFEGARSAGVTLGSGVAVVLDDTVDMTGFVARVARFFRDESCGQCVPCRVGTQRQEELLGRLAAGRPLGSPGAELALLGDLDQVMRDASICGLGQTASSVAVSALRRGLLEDGAHRQNGVVP
ncbi:MAG: NAD(P)H-dependent oxidoreductase subunit E [Actinomycetota bacterium]|jgi:NADH-quinone oxidoreductase subunit F|nr:NAD(P)H-dependent oxidoreductase subunit E [Actinomycetota bacterium]